MRPNHLAALLAVFFATQARAAQAGLTPAQSAAIDRYITAEMARERVPGVQIGIYRDGHALLEKGYGLANIEWNAKVTPTTLFQSGSTGKAFTATAIMMLVEQGKLSLDDSIATYFPGAPAFWAAIRIKNLLSHTSGLAEYETDARDGPGGPFDLRLDFSEDELLRKIQALPMEFKAGDKWDYRNTNYVLLGILIHHITGQYYGDFLHDRIFARLGMAHTRIISDRDIIPGRAAGYEIAGGVLKNQSYVSPTFNATADGTLYYNVVDLEKWDRAQYGTALLSQASLQRMWTPFVLNNGQPNGAGYGFGWAVGDFNGHRVIHHSGAWQGFTTDIERYTDDKLTVVALTNLDSAHATPAYMTHVVAGLVEPALMPQPAGPIPDTMPALATSLVITLQNILAGKNVAADFAPSAGYQFDAADAADLRGSLPAGWHGGAPTLIKRGEDDGNIRSVYRLGQPGDTRVVRIVTDPAGKLTSYAVTTDPDAR